MPLNLCIIAGRGGSKRLPGKNLLPFCGKPLIVHTIQQARESGVCDAILVTSDDEAILDAARRAGVDILIKRPVSLATDCASSIDVIKHAIWGYEHAEGYDNIIFLQITSPLRTAEDIKKAVGMFTERNASNLLSVSKIKNDKCLIPGTAWSINGAIYIWNKNKFFDSPQHVYADTILMEMPADRSVDIDTREDFDYAESLMKTANFLKEAACQ